MSKQYDERALLIAALFLSVLAHGFSWIALSWVDIEHFTRLIAEVEFTMIEEIEEPELLPLPEEPEPEPEPEPEIRRPPPVAEVEPERELEPPPPLEETPVAFDNIVLTNDQGEEGWAVHQGSGVDREGPVGRPTAAATGRSREGSPDGVPEGTGEGPAVLPMTEMMRRPEPPRDLDQMLQRFYPQEARRQGVEGRSQLRIRINADGSVAVLRTVGSTDPQFASACTRMLRQTRWRPGLGPNGEPAATVTNFACDFTVTY